MLEKLAELLGGQLACTRPMAEAGWLDAEVPDRSEWPYGPPEADHHLRRVRCGPVYWPA